MFQLWDSIIEPVLRAVQPSSIVEIGCDEGVCTELLLQYAVRSGDVSLDAIDPLPKFDVEDWEQRYGAHLRFHRGLSLEVLPHIDPPGVVLIDGDHNWYTVFHELQALADLSEATGAPLPVVLLHDVGWPYGRRDLYYDPDTIPPDYRKPHVRGGLVLGESAPVEEGGLNAHLLNAVVEGGNRNGVLTAVEDFMAQSPRSLERTVLPGLSGLALVYTRQLREEMPAFGELIEALSPSPLLIAYLEEVEEQRLLTQHRAIRLDGARKEAEAAECQSQRLLEAQRQRVDDAQRRVAEAVADAQRRVAEAVADAQRRTAELRRTVEGLETALERTEAARASTHEKLEALRRRRSVRLALAVAKLVGPGVRLTNRIRAAVRRGSRGARDEAGEKRRRIVARRAAPLPTRSATADIVVCVHNAYEDVAACLESVGRHTNLVRHNLILVDDGSDEPTHRLLVDFAARLNATLIRNEEALGYTRAANIGLRNSTLDHVILLNSDTVVTPDWAERLIRCAAMNPDAGVVGPLSNAASWQSIPTLLTEDGGWKVNELPSGRSAIDIAASLDVWSPALYPRVPLVNGFCYLITRAAIDAVGLLDEEAFPRGYGEEDDFSIRCASHGFGLYVADDCYVYHAKSKSFTPEGRTAIVQRSKGALVEKHGEATIRGLVDDIKHGEDLVRARTFASLVVSSNLGGLHRDLSGSMRRIGWLQPHLGEVGGIRRTIEMSNRLVAWGWDVDLIIPSVDEVGWLSNRARVISVDDALGEEFDILICSDPDMVDAFEHIQARERLVYYLAAYLLYRRMDDSITRFYRTGESAHHIANSTWTAEHALEAAGVTVEGIFAGGIDRNQFHPVRVEPSHEVVCYGSLREHKGTQTIERATKGLSLLRLVDHSPKQSDLARLISAGRVFASGGWHEGFNFMPLEAMACGVPVVMTDDGGSREYAEDGVNALVVPPRDVPAMRTAIERLLHDRELRVRLIEGGLQTAWEYDWDDVTSQFADYVISITDKPNS